MAKYRDNLPQLGDKLFLTDGGIETTLIFHNGFDLPEFAAFDILKTSEGMAALRRYFQQYAGIARDHGLGFILESPTWRSSPDWGAKIGYSEAALAQANHQAIALMEDIRAEFESEASPMVISGCLGPRGDGYLVGELMTPAAAERYHAVQINTFRDSQADMVTAVTMTYTAEAIGVARAAAAAGLPVVISFTVETDGCLPSGQPLGEAIIEVDEATGRYPAYYMINCAHPTHFDHALTAGASWLGRIRGLRANASTMSHAELDEAEELDDGNPQELGQQYQALRRQLTQLTVMGGCCGTDHRHVAAIAQACQLQPA